MWHCLRIYNAALFLVVGNEYVFPLAVIAITACVGIVAWVVFRDSEPGGAKLNQSGYWPYIVFIAGVVLIAQNGYELANKHGGWDAWAFWNMHGKYLADPTNWRQLFLRSPGDHPDYPLLVPGTNAFFSRLFLYSMAIQYYYKSNA